MSSTPPEVVYKGAFSVTQHIQFLSYFDVISSAVIIYDVLLTIGLEVELIWKAPWTLLKVVYLVQKYLPLVDTVGLGIYRLRPDLSAEACFLDYKITSYMWIIGTILSEVVLTCRFAAFKPYRMCHRGCEADILSALGAGAGLRYCALDPDVCSWDFRLQKGWQLRVIQRHGVLYYLYIIAIFVVNIVLSFTLAAALSTILISLARVMQAILTSRVLLLIRYQIKVDVVYGNTQLRVHQDLGTKTHGGDLSMLTFATAQTSDTDTSSI